MYIIIYLTIFGFVLGLCGISVTNKPVSATLLLAMAVLGLFVGGLIK